MTQPVPRQEAHHLQARAGAGARLTPEVIQDEHLTQAGHRRDVPLRHAYHILHLVCVSACASGLET